jgi:hypothetical protein
LYNPYIVTCDTGLAAGASLTIEAGTEIRFDALAGLTIHGELQATGTITQPIVMTRTVALLSPLLAGLTFDPRAQSPGWST